jgi:hypothetical protein
MINTPNRSTVKVGDRYEAMSRLLRQVEVLRSRRILDHAVTDQ